MALVFLIGIILLPEGIVCWIMASPIFLGVAVLASAGAHRVSENKANRTRAVLLLPLAILSFEGALIGDLVSTNGSATSAVVVDLGSQEVQARLAATPEFAEVKGFLALGFPKPIAATGSGLALGDERIITFSDGTADQPSQMHLVVSHTDANTVVFDIIKDTTAIASWADLNEAIVTWTDNGSTTTATWTLQWERKLRPGIYFGPLQDFAMEKAATYLLESTLG